MTNAVLIFNSNTKRVIRERIDERDLIRRLEVHGISVRPVEYTGIDGIPSKLSALPDDSLLILAGGDGTVYEAIQDIECRRLRIGIIPLGAANNLAIAAGIPLDIESAVRAISEGRERIIDLGKAGSCFFTQAAGAGFFAEVLRIYGKRKRNLPLGILSLLKALAAWKPKSLRLTVDGEIMDAACSQVMVTNTPYYGNRLCIAPEAKIDDGKFEVLIIHPTEKMEILSLMLNLMKGRTLPASNLTRVQAVRVLIECVDGTAAPVHADADPIGYAPIEVKVVSSCLRLIVPK